MRRLRVLHIIPSLSPERGGPSAALPLMARALVTHGVEVTVVTTDDDGPVRRRHDVRLGEPLTCEDGATYLYFPRQLSFYTVSWPLRQWLSKHIREFDVVHIHALFSFSSTVAARLARRAGVPYVIRPLGVLNRWGIANRRRVLKQFSLRYVELPILCHAAAIHYTSRREQEEAAAAHPVISGLRAEVIPLPIEIHPPSKNVAVADFLAGWPMGGGRQVILFLSRIDEKKGLDLLLPAFAQVQQSIPEALLVIAGSGNPEYIKRLHEQAAELKIAEQIVWTGFLEGAAKSAAFAASTVFVLPSYSENFGIAAAEALAAGVACVLSENVAVAEKLEHAAAGVVVPCKVTAIADGIEQLLRDSKKRSELGANARSFVARRFSMESVGSVMAALYRSLAQTAAKDIGHE